jgi:hypothetical protein
MQRDTTSLATRLDRETVRTVTKTTLAAGVLVFLLYLVTLLPGVDRLIPRTPVTFAAVFGTVVTVALVTLLLYAAPKTATLARRRLEGPRAVVENLATVVFWLVVLAAVLVAHAGFSAVVVPSLGDAAWVYDLGFLVLALLPVVAIAGSLYASLDPGAEAVADRVVEADDTSTASSDHESDSRLSGATGDE